MTEEPRLDEKLALLPLLLWRRGEKASWTGPGLDELSETINGSIVVHIERHASSQTRGNVAMTVPSRKQGDGPGRERLVEAIIQTQNGRRKKTHWISEMVTLGEKTQERAIWIVWLIT